MLAVAVCRGRTSGHWEGGLDSWKAESTRRLRLHLGGQDPGEWRQTGGAIAGWHGAWLDPGERDEGGSGQSR